MRNGKSHSRGRIGHHTQTVLANRIACKNAAATHAVKILMFFFFRKLDLTRTSLHMQRKQKLKMLSFSSERQQVTIGESNDVSSKFSFSLRMINL